MKKLGLALLLAAVLGGALAPPTLAQQAVSPCVRNDLGGCAPVTSANPLPVIISGEPENLAEAVTTDDEIAVADAETFVGLAVNTAGTTSAIEIIDGALVEDACVGTTLATIATTAQVVLTGYNIPLTTGLCVITTSNTDPADLTVLYR